MNSPRSEDLCKLSWPSGSCEKCFLVCLPCYKPISIFLQKLQVLPIFRLPYSLLLLKVRAKASPFLGWHITVFLVRIALESMLWSVLPGVQGEVFCTAFCIEFLLCCWSVENGGQRSVRWPWVTSGGLKARNKGWTLMSALAKVCERSAVNFGFEFPPVGVNEVFPSFS